MKKKKQSSNETGFKNIIEYSNNVAIIPESSKEMINSSMYSIEKQDHQIEIIVNRSAKKISKEMFKLSQTKLNRYFEDEIVKTPNPIKKSNTKEEKIIKEDGAGTSTAPFYDKDITKVDDIKLKTKKNIQNLPKEPIKEEKTQKHTLEYYVPSAAAEQKKKTMSMENIIPSKLKQLKEKENKDPNSIIIDNDLLTSILERKGKEAKKKSKGKSALFEKTTRRHNNNLEANIDRTKEIDKELDLGFLPQDLLYTDKTTYGESSVNLLAAIEILEKAQDNKNKLIKNEVPQEKSFWSFINPFQCGSYN